MANSRTHQQTCLHCGKTFKASRSRHVYCCQEHRREAFAVKKEMSVEALWMVYGQYGIEREAVRETVYYAGASRVSRLLKRLGFTYDDSARKWLRVGKTHRGRRETAGRTHVER